MKPYNIDFKESRKAQNETLSVGKGPYRLLGFRKLMKHLSENKRIFDPMNSLNSHPSVTDQVIMSNGSVDFPYHFSFIQDVYHFFFRVPI